ncbi:MAG: hypothetical protein ACK4UO_01480 [Pseudolabrys sp.]
MNSEAELLEFVASSFKSVWALEVVLALRRNRDRTWRPDDIIKELRSSRLVVAEALNNLAAAGLVAEEDGGGFRYAAADALEETMAEVDKLYAVKPTVVIRSIVSTPNAKLQILSNAFRIKE